MNQFFSFKKILIAAIAAILILAGFIFVDRFQKAQRVKRLEKKAGEAGVLHKSGEFEKAITALEGALEDAEESDTLKQARIRAIIAFDKYFKGSPEQKIEAVNDLKAMIEDTSFSTHLRSQLMNGLVDLITATNDEDFARNVIFTGDPYQNILKNANGDIPTAIRLLYERSIEINPNSVAYLWNAYWYVQQLIRNQNLSQEQRTRYLGAAKEKLAEGGALIVRDVAIAEATTFIPKKSRAIRPYFYQASVAGALAILNEYDAKSAEELFKQTLALHKDEDLADFAVFDSYLRVRFQYAAVLASIAGKSRQSDIRELLKPMAKLAEPEGSKYPFKFKLLNEYQQSLKKDPARIRFIDYREVILLAGLDPDFKAVMEKIGWKF